MNLVTSLKSIWMIYFLFEHISIFFKNYGIFSLLENAKGNIFYLPRVSIKNYILTISYLSEDHSSK